MATVTVAPGPFVIGNDVTVTETFKDAAGTPVIPSSVFFEWRAQDKNGLILQSVTPITPINHGGGIYSADIPTDTGAGVYYWRFWSTGTGKAAEEGGFAVSESQFINVPGGSPASGGGAGGPRNVYILPITAPMLAAGTPVLVPLDQTPTAVVGIVSLGGQVLIADYLVLGPAANITVNMVDGLGRPIANAGDVVMLFVH